MTENEAKRQIKEHLVIAGCEDLFCDVEALETAIQALEEIQQYRAIGTVRELTALKDTEEQGLLLRLPCKVGDKVWAVTSTANYSLGEYSEVPLIHPHEKKIQSITITKNGLLYHVKDRTYTEKDFGETVFLTKEKAEQALMAM